jgi:hypothetical protein
MKTSSAAVMPLLLAILRESAGGVWVGLGSFLGSGSWFDRLTTNGVWLPRNGLGLAANGIGLGANDNYAVSGFPAAPRMTPICGGGALE